LREVALDLAEGADSVMVKPGLPYLDIVRAVKEAVRGAGLRLSGERRIRDDRGGGGRRRGDRDALVLETLLAFKRAGCSGRADLSRAHAARLLG
jgi:porphobilinogen synthase